jgi:hypothetical protein
LETSREEYCYNKHAFPPAEAASGALTRHGRVGVIVATHDTYAVVMERSEILQSKRIRHWTHPIILLTLSCMMAMILNVWKIL